ncbi:MAG: deoxycytidylate deaminase [Candidatus Thorarchaeota archaeon]
MTCKNCGTNKPGDIIKVTPDLMHCAVCGEKVDPYKRYVKIDNNWDRYFHSICESVASKSPCLSRKIGAILVRDHSIVSTGYNGPPRGIPHCGHDRYMNDDTLYTLIQNPQKFQPHRIRNECPRKILGYASGTHMELCPAQHAEENTVSNAARLGVSVIGTTLYMNSVIPCKNCFGTLINAGIVEIVVDEVTVYDKHTQFLINNSVIKLRRFEL